MKKYLVALVFYTSNYPLIRFLRANKVTGIRLLALKAFYNSYVYGIIGGILYFGYYTALAISYLRYQTERKFKHLLKYFTNKDFQELELDKVEVAKLQVPNSNAFWYVCQALPASFGYDFLKNRIIVYLPQIINSYKDAFRLWQGNLPYPIISGDKELAQSLLNSSMCTSLQLKGEYYEVNLEQISRIKFLEPNFIADVRSCSIHKDSLDIKVRMSDGKIYSSADPEWQVVKLYLQCAISFAVPALIHNWCHFYYGEVFAGLCFNHLPKHTNLYKLLYPHIRFIMQVNYRATRVRQATDNKFGNDYEELIAWQITSGYHAHEFVENTLGASSYYYGADIGIPNIYKDNDVCYVRNDSLKIALFDRLELPLVQSYKKYYDCLYNFIQQVMASLSEHEHILFNELLRKLHLFIPSINFEQAPKEQLLTDLIFQGSFVHSWEHVIFSAWNLKHGCVKITVPFIEAKDFEDNISAKVLKMHDIWHARAADRMFFDYHNVENDNQTMDIIDYKFTDPKLQQLNESFRQELLAIEKSLAQQGAVHVKLRQTATCVSF